MEVIQIIKKLNNTELGKKNTHESYILVNRGLDISDLFKKTNVPLQFIFKKNNKEVITYIYKKLEDYFKFLQMIVYLC